MDRSKNFLNKIGEIPGSLYYTGDSVTNTEFTLIQYDENDYLSLASLETPEILSKIDKKKVNWINVNGLNNNKLLQEIGDNFNLHPLTLEDVLTTHLHPRIEIFDDYIYLTLKMIKINPKKPEQYEVENLSLVLGDYYLLSFQENSTDLFETIRDRIYNYKGKVRKRKNDYLLYLLVDIVVDNYFYLLDFYEERISKLEIAILQDSSLDANKEIISFKKNLIKFKKMLFPLREALRSLTKSEISFINKEYKHHFADTNDHLNTILRDLDSQKENLTSIMDIHLSNLSQKMNEIIRILTIISTIFIPLTFIVGVYGMNFKFMPELEYKIGYPIVWIVLIATGLGMWFYMRKRGFFK